MEEKIFRRARFLIGFLGRDVRNSISQAIMETCSLEEIRDVCNMYNISLDEYMDSLVLKLEEEV